MQTQTSTFIMCNDYEQEVPPKLQLSSLADPGSVAVENEPSYNFEFSYLKSLLAFEQESDQDTPILISPCHQFIEWNSNSFLYASSHESVDVSILTFNSTHPRYAYVELDQCTGWVTNCIFGVPKSGIACTGIVYFKNGNLFLENLRKAVENDIGREYKHTKFAIIEVVNEAIKSGLNVRSVSCQRIWELTSPIDVKGFLNTLK